MAPNPQKSRMRALFKRSGKAIGNRFNTIFPTSESRSSSTQPPAPPNTTNPLLEPLGVAENQSRHAILPKFDDPSLDLSSHPRINPANAGTVTVVEASRPGGDERLTSDRLSQDSPSTTPGDNYSNRLLKAGNVAWKTLETALRLLNRSDGVFPPLKSAVGGLVACLNLTQVSHHVRFHILYHL